MEDLREKGGEADGHGWVEKGWGCEAEAVDEGSFA
jgi:hypothetical protein